MIKLTTKDDKKYIDVTKRSKMPYQIFIGARGTGKTFSALRNELNDDETKEHFIYLRNSQREAEVATSNMGNAFKSLNTIFNKDIQGNFDSKLGLGYFTDNHFSTKEDPKEVNVIGYAFGLSTVAGARSIDLSDVERIIFEEFIPEIHVRKMKNRGAAFANFMETANRNRESVGKPPITCYLLANAINLSDEILETLQATSEIETMIRAGEKRRTIPERGLYIELIDDVAILEEKANSALYRVLASEYKEDALSADFHNERLELINKNFNRNQYDLFLSYSTIAFYKSKNAEKFYVANNGEQAGTGKNIPITDVATLKRNIYYWYIKNMGKNRIEFDKFTTRRVVEEALGI